MCFDYKLCQAIEDRLSRLCPVGSHTIPAFIAILPCPVQDREHNNASRHLKFRVSLDTNVFMALRYI